MRTTLDIDQDVWAAVKEIAQQRGVTAGSVVSELVRQSLTKQNELTFRNGVPLLPRRSKKGTVVTLELVNSLRDE